MTRLPARTKSVSLALVVLLTGVAHATSAPDHATTRRASTAAAGTTTAGDGTVRLAPRTRPAAPSGARAAALAGPQDHALSPLPSLLPVPSHQPTGTPASAGPGPDSTSGRSVAIGVNVAGDDNAVDLAAYTSAAGRNPAVVMWYASWKGPLYWPRQMDWADGVGATPMITWDPYNSTGQTSFAAIAAGLYDNYLDSSAALAVQYGRPLLLRFSHEMNLPSNGSTGGPAGPATFVAAWRHVVNRFAADGATNVRWVWSPSVDCAGSCPFTSYFPGDAYVDYVGLDGYNYAEVHQTPWLTFSQVFSSSYDTITRLSTKPVIIAETATAGTGDQRAEWITSAFSNAVPALFPRVVAVVWFNRVKETDWRVTYSSSVLSAWRAVVSNPFYQGRLAPAPS